MRFLITKAVASEYYISASGDDSNKGTSEQTAWMSIEKLNATRLRPGDGIFFHRGDTFRGQLRIGDSGTQKNAIVISAYGTGTKPVLSGATLVTSWNSFSNGIWVARQPDAVSEVYFNDKLQCLARYPATGFRKIKQGDKTGLIDEAGLPAGLDLTNATLRIRAVDWQYEVMKVASQTSNGITFAGKMKYQCSPGFGYFVDNKLEFLNRPGEWFYDSNSRLLYFMPPDQVKPVDNKVEATILSCGLIIESGVSNVAIHDLEFSQYGTAAICGMESSSRVSISNCTIRNIGVYGITLDVNSNHYLIANNEIEDISGRGISTLESLYNVISGNVIRRIGLLPGYGFDGVNNATGIAVIKREIRLSISDGMVGQLKRENVPSPVLDRIRTMVGFPYTNEKLLQAALVDKLGNLDADRFSAQILQLVRERMRVGPKLESCQNRVADNVIEDTGYVGIRLDGHDNMAECNVIKNSLCNMADGGALYCWAQNDLYTYNETFRSNIIINVLGNVAGTPNSRPLRCGIYLDNKTHHITVEKNILMQSGLGIFVNCESHDQQIIDNTCYNNESGLTFNEYLQLGSLTGCSAFGNVLFAMSDQQRALLLESSLQENFRPVDLQNNLYGGPSSSLIQFKYLCNGSSRTNNFTLPQWRRFYGGDTNSIAISASKSVIFINEERIPMTFAVTNNLGYRDLEGHSVEKQITLQPFTGKINIQKSEL